MTVVQLIRALMELQERGYGFCEVGVDSHETDELSPIRFVGVPTHTQDMVELRFDGQSILPLAKECT